MNPLSHQCPGCKAMLTTGKTGAAFSVIAIIIGITIAIVGIAFERKGLWTNNASLLWYLLTIVICLPAFQYLAWKTCKFHLK